MIELAWYAAAFLAAIILVTGIFVHGWFGKPGRQELAKFRRRIIKKKGWTAFRSIGSFHLLSVDGGQNWYMVEEMQPGTDTIGIPSEPGLKILGPADARCPGLLDHLAAAEKLSEFYWSMTSSEESFGMWRRQLERAGFTFNDEKLPSLRVLPPLRGETVADQN